MHALITNLALNYSPDEIDLYLIDFKKGVEFKVYATHELPHASVVAIESEREFGISVLERLDAELRLRADRFRDAGVQDFSGYRNVPGTPPLPRILLIVDEFQEFFVEEDKLAQEAALWLDRLVRQGRAFGIHVMLGSQSLGGAFTLARSTLGQMAVRIALQCSETDAHLILSENNIAPRMLSRPGEAIYNDANGAPEGNHFFQVVWLSDERREAYLKQLHERRPGAQADPGAHADRLRGGRPGRPGAQPVAAATARGSDLARRHRARPTPGWATRSRSRTRPRPCSAARAATTCSIVGQNEEAALGVAGSTLVEPGRPVPASQRPTPSAQGARFFVLDGTPGRPSQYAECCIASAAALPHEAVAGGWREVSTILAAVAAELQRRQEAKTATGPSSSCSFTTCRGSATSAAARTISASRAARRKRRPPDHLDPILRDGPVLGVHLVTWCDYGQQPEPLLHPPDPPRVRDARPLPDEPDRFGPPARRPSRQQARPAHRAYFASEEQNRLEKFRPYGIPSADWLDQFGGQLSSRPVPAGSPS